jgi:NADPH:quinone reductase-like Zn-dependent oxidoreductase
MKAIVQEGYTSLDAVELRDLPTPVAGDDEVLVRVRATCVNPPDWASVTGIPYVVRAMVGVREPDNPIRGTDLSGTVAAVGKNVRRLKVGDEVFGTAAGTFAEYVVAAQDALAPKPANVTFEQAAAVPMSGLTALQGLRDVGRLQPGQKVLIIGAGGGIGTFAVQIAVSLGAQVTGVCSTSKVDLVRSLGAERIIDYTRQKVTDGDERYDLILDNVSRISLPRLRALLTPGGTLIPNGGRFDKRWLANAPVMMIQAPLLSLLGSQHVRTIRLAPNLKDWLVLKDLMESGKVIPIVGKTYPLSQTSEALTYFAQGHSRGKVVITV